MQSIAIAGISTAGMRPCEEKFWGKLQAGCEVSCFLNTICLDKFIKTSGEVTHPKMVI